MEERILEKLDEMNKKFDTIDKKFDHIEKMIIKENTKIKEELRTEFKEGNAKLKAEIKTDLKQEVREYVKKEILDHIFVFEEQYGRKLTIAFEQLISKAANEKIQNESIADLKRMSEVHTAYVYNHEDRIDKLENVQI